MKLKHWVRYILWSDTTWHGEFAALRPLLRDLPEPQRIVVDVGANDGFYGSNSYPFIKRGWRAILVEPHPGAFAKAAQRHAGNRKVILLNIACCDVPGTLPLILFADDEGGSHSTLDHPAEHPAGKAIEKRISVEVRPLEEVLARESVPFDFGLLSIDAEGQDFRVIQGLNLERFRPKIIFTEKNANDNLKFEHLRTHGYRLAKELWADTIWTPS